MAKGRKKLKDMNYADGRDYAAPNETVAAPKTVDEVLNPNPAAKYKQTSEAQYNQSLQLLNKIDLQHECIRIGLLPTDDRGSMIDRLLKEYRVDYAANRPLESKVVHISQKNEEKGKEILRRCFEGNG